MASKETSPEANNGNPSHFIQPNEIRSATDSDFEYFIQLAEREDGWIKKLDKNNITIWQKETGVSSIRMAKVGHYKSTGLAKIVGWCSVQLAAPPTIII